MKRISLTATCIVCLGLTGSTLVASDPVGIYTIIDKVILEPSAEAPERAQIWGAFSINTGPGMGDTYKPPVRGYLYYSVDPNNVKPTLIEWSDLSKLAGTDEIVGFASRYEPTGTVRSGCEEPRKPDVYPIALGLMKFRTDSGYQPIADLLGMVRPLSPEDGSTAVRPGAVKLSVRNILTPDHPRAIYFFDLLSSSGESLESWEATPGEGTTSVLTEYQLVQGRQYTWSVEAFEGDWRSTPASACFTLPFLRGDSNGDRGVDLSDAIFDLNYLFSGGAAPQPLDAGDMDGNGALELTDPVYLLMFLFQGGRAPPLPFPEPGLMPSAP